MTERTRKLLDGKFKGLIQPDEYKIIPTTKGMFAMVSNSDFDRLRNIPWSMVNDKYAENHKLGLMHRHISGAGIGMVVDHIDGNGLNNRRSNLRVCSQQENSFNQRLRKDKSNSTSKYKGVSFHRQCRKWRSYIVMNNKQISLGLFNSEEEAGVAYNLKAIEMYGDFALLNKIK